MSFAAQYIDALISFSVGVCCTYLAFRSVPASSPRAAEWQRWHATWGRRMKFIGPMLMVTGLVQGVFKIAI